MILFIVSHATLPKVQAQANEDTCEVDIITDWLSNVMYPGQEAQFEANVTNTSSNKIDYSWFVEGPIIKDYDDSVKGSDYLKSTKNVGNYSLMNTTDFKKNSITFYWQVNKTEPMRTVSVHVSTSNGEVCNDSIQYIVDKGNDTDHQAEDFYAGSNHKSFGTGPNDNRVLREHLKWHQDNRCCTDYNGTLFLDFHDVLIEHFNAYRHTFDYDNITSWDPKDELPSRVHTDHEKREIGGIPYVPYLNQSLPEWFKNHANNDGPQKRYPIENECDPAMKNTSKVEDSLGDFNSNRSTLGCVLTSPFHDSVHMRIGQEIDIDQDGEVEDLGDMSDAVTAPKDPVFWMWHSYINEISKNRTAMEPSSIDKGFLIMDASMSSDTTKPQIVSQNPFRIQPFITELPKITEQERDLFGLVDVEAISVEFNEPVTGIKADSLVVNGSASTQVNGSGAGPYVFIGFEPPSIGSVNVKVLPENIIDLSGNNFAGDSWNYVLVNKESDMDLDGAKDDIEVDILLTDPQTNDTDSDTMPDGFEAISGCLDPLVDDRHLMDIAGNIVNNNSRDQDEDGISSIDEFRIGTDPCVTDQIQNESATINSFTELDDHPNESLISDSLIPNEEQSNESFTLEIKRIGGLSGENVKISYNSINKELVLVTDSNETSKQLSKTEESTASRALINSGFFDAQNSYPPTPNSTDYQEYTIIAALNGQINSVYFTTTSEDVPETIKNLPFYLASMLNMVI